VVRLVKDQLKQHMASLGLVVDRPTRISLVHWDAFGPWSPHVRSHELGRTSWTFVGDRVVDGPIVVEVLRNLPLPRFRHVLAHEFGHAALACSARSHRLSLRVQEGFAEATAVVHLQDSQRDVDRIVDDLLANPDPVYGAGLRLVLPAVERHGLATVLRALRAGDEQVLGTRPRAAG